jgi:hypothetical protein
VSPDAEKATRIAAGKGSNTLARLLAGFVSVIMWSRWVLKSAIAPK